MAYSSSTHHVRSASYPPNTNPIILTIDQQLTRLRECEASSTSPMQTISIGLTGLAGLYKCVDDALILNYFPHLNTTTRIEHLVNGSSKLLEVCIASRDVLGRLREPVGELRSSDEKLPEVSGYFSTRREIARNAKGLVLSLRQVEGELILENRELSWDESELTRVFRCISIINISVMESLLQLMSSKLPRWSRFSLISKMLVGKAEEVCTGKGNELSTVDAVLHDVLSRGKADGERMVIAEKRLEELEEGLREIENGLSCISSQLAKTRASLLKIVSF